MQELILSKSDFWSKSVEAVDNSDEIVFFKVGFLVEIVWRLWSRVTIFVFFKV